MVNCKIKKKLNFELEKRDYHDKGLKSFVENSGDLVDYEPCNEVITLLTYSFVYFLQKIFYLPACFDNVLTNLKYQYY